MTILNLTLKHKWFDLIERGIKKEEYREVKPHWISRFVGNPKAFWEFYPQFDFRGFTHVKFTLGYQRNAPTMTFKIDEVDIGKAVPEWSEGWEEPVFRIKLGQRI